MVVDELNDSVSPALINLKSFQGKETINLKIWTPKGIKSEVRIALLQIAKEFIDSMVMYWVNPSDIIVVGSITGFNWSKYSDIDLHLVYDFSEINENVEFIKDYFDSKKILWNNQHGNLKIYGYEVELYVQDINEPNATESQYSLVKDIWVTLPQTKDMRLNNALIREQSAKLINMADDLIRRVRVCRKRSELLELSDELNDLYSLIVKGRKEGLKNEGETSPQNIIFKVLRRTGHLEQLRNLKYYVFDRLHSL